MPAHQQPAPDTPEWEIWQSLWHEPAPLRERARQAALDAAAHTQIKGKALSRIHGAVREELQEHKVNNLTRGRVAAREKLRKTREKQADPDHLKRARTLGNKVLSTVIRKDERRQAVKGKLKAGVKKTQKAHLITLERALTKPKHVRKADRKLSAIKQKNQQVVADLYDGPFWGIRHLESRQHGRAALRRQYNRLRDELHTEYVRSHPDVVRAANEPRERREAVAEAHRKAAEHVKQAAVDKQREAEFRSGLVRDMTERAKDISDDLIKAAKESPTAVKAEPDPDKLAEQPFWPTLGTFVGRYFPRRLPGIKEGTFIPHGAKRVNVAGRPDPTAPYRPKHNAKYDEFAGRGLQEAMHHQLVDGTIPLFGAVVFDRISQDRTPLRLVNGRTGNEFYQEGSRLKQEIKDGTDYLGAVSALLWRAGFINIEEQGLGNFHRARFVGKPRYDEASHTMAMQIEYDPSNELHQLIPGAAGMTRPMLQITVLDYRRPQKYGVKRVSEQDAPEMNLRLIEGAIRPVTT